MKKIILLALAAISVSLVSCKKEYVCECTGILITSTTNGTPSGGTATRITKRNISKTSKKNAEAICGNYTETANTYYQGSGFGGSTVYADIYNTTCSLR